VIVVLSEPITQVKPPVVRLIQPLGSHGCHILECRRFNECVYTDGKYCYLKNWNQEKKNKIKWEKTWEMRGL